MDTSSIYLAGVCTTTSVVFAVLLCVTQLFHFKSEDYQIDDVLTLVNEKFLWYVLTTWSKVLPEKLLVPQPRNSPPYMEPKGSLSCSQGPAT